VARDKKKQTKKENNEAHYGCLWIKIKFKSLFKAITFIRGLFCVERSLRKRKKSVFFMIHLVISDRCEQISFLQFFFLKVGLLKGNGLRMELIIMDKFRCKFSSKL